MLLSATLLLLAAAPASDTAFRVQEGLPADFVVDGRLAEWTQPPSLTLSGTAGGGKEASPDTVSVRLWLAVDPGGLAIAGEVRDAQAQISGDPVEVRLALPPPKLPPLAFVDQFQEHPVPTQGDCPRKPPKKAAACEAWWRQQTELRQQLQDALVARYSLRSGGVVRFGQTDTIGTARYAPFPGGYRFEARIPAEAFPRTAEAPLRLLSVHVDLWAGEAEANSRTLRASTPGFQTVRLSMPLRYGKWPELLERALAAQPGASYQPGPAADALEVWVNPARAYQYVPKAPSPAVVRVDLTQVQELATVGDLRLVSVPVEVNRRGTVDRWLLSLRGQTVLDTRNIGDATIRVAPRTEGASLLQVYEGPANPMGTGTCGECPKVSFQHFTLDARGRFSEAVPLKGTGGRSPRPVAWSASPDLTLIEAFDVLPAPLGRQLAVRHSWDPETGRYTTSSPSP
ncbi:hypothetical protein ACLESD_21960 [Pyxidicoccus sp. 3LFB2]